SDLCSNYLQNLNLWVRLWVKVLWLYKEDDDDMQETGEEFSSDLSLPFELKSYK
ncbi:SiaC family regulatory phosphoprotein, partial [Leptospira interrogans]|uniref:SiaC family regulatory phosphoprotein n=1 Tax=Leptospira interrogans TaxID=173 RepID=UPI004035212A